MKTCPRESDTSWYRGFLGPVKSIFSRRYGLPGSVMKSASAQGSIAFVRSSSG